MGQSKVVSFIESLTNVGVGFITTLVFSPLIYWICDIHMSGLQMGSATGLFTILSVARSYIIRRWFNSKDNPLNVEEDKEVA